MSASDQIESHCRRALRRLDVLIRERDDVLLRAAREEVRRALSCSLGSAPRTNSDRSLPQAS